MTKCDIGPESNGIVLDMISNVKMRYLPKFECQNMISNVKMKYSARIRM